MKNFLRNAKFYELPDALVLQDENYNPFIVYKSQEGDNMGKEPFYVWSDGFESLHYSIDECIKMLYQAKPSSMRILDSVGSEFLVLLRPDGMYSFEGKDCYTTYTYKECLERQA